MNKILHHPAFKLTELMLFFIGLPLLYYFNLIPFHKSIPLLAVFFLFLIVLIRDENFNSKKFSFNKFRNWRLILARFAAFVIISAVAVYYFSKDFLFSLPKENTKLWLLIILLYPIWSAFPQELIYRSWFFHRYRDLVKKEWVFVGINAILFSFSHIIFENLLAIILTFIGGILFAFTYKKSNSLMVVFTEHTIYGLWIFTVGIGQYFYTPVVTS